PESGGQRLRFAAGKSWVGPVSSFGSFVYDPNDPALLNFRETRHLVVMRKVDDYIRSWNAAHVITSDGFCCELRGVALDRPPLLYLDPKALLPISPSLLLQKHSRGPTSALSYSPLSPAPSGFSFRKLHHAL